MSNIPPCDNEIKSLLKGSGAESVEELFSVIDPALRSGPLGIERGMSEFEVMGRLKEISARNESPRLSFTGGGFYRHIIPSAVDYVSSLGAFYTAYTPYQGECSQGTLQAMFEYQSAVAELTSMEVSNASLYDGATAMAEAALMALRITGRSKVILCGCVNPLYKNILRTYVKNTAAAIVELPPENFGFNREEFNKVLDEDSACVIYQNPNFFGTIEDCGDIVLKAKDEGALAVAGFNPLSLAMLKTPGECGADIAFGEGQSLGIPLSGGGPYLGMLAAGKKYIRALPGRIAGRTRGEKGDGYVLTLQAREQHIRRQRATSNICTNQALCALRALVFLAVVGKEGLVRLAGINYDAAHECGEVLSGIKNCKVLNKVFFNEFVLQLPCSSGSICAALAEKGIEAGIPLGDYYSEKGNMLLVACTEKTTKEDMDKFAGELEKAVEKECGR